MVNSKSLSLGPSKNDYTFSPTSGSVTVDGYDEVGVDFTALDDLMLNARLTDNGDGTVKDERTGLLWLKDANCFSSTS